jgi:hypothetical protein
MLTEALSTTPNTSSINGQKSGKEGGIHGNNTNLITGIEIHEPETK